MTDPLHAPSDLLEARDRDVGLVGPGADELDDLVACMVGAPALGESSARLFLARCGLPGRIGIR